MTSDASHQPGVAEDNTAESIKLRKLTETSPLAWIPEDELTTTLQKPPFIAVPGTFNVRDLGLIDVDHPSTITASKIRPGFIYRAGALDELTQAGHELLRDRLGVRRIFDLRTEQEQKSRPDPKIEGVDVVCLGNGGTAVEERNAIVDVTRFDEGRGEKGYVAMYCDILTEYQDVFRAVLMSVRDRPTEPILFHCTAGRDRTGVLAGILESLAGYDPKLIQLDWLLSRIGYEPAKAKLMAYAAGASTAGPSEGQKGPGFMNLISLTPSCWDAFLDTVGDKYGGFEGYAISVLGLEKEDLVKIKMNLARAPSA